MPEQNLADATTNWAVATTGIALSVTFSNAGNSPLPLVLVALMSLVFLSIEGRRYRYFDIWRTRVRILETGMYGPILRGERGKGHPLLDAPTQIPAAHEADVAPSIQVLVIRARDRIRPEVSCVDAIAP